MNEAIIHLTEKELASMGKFNSSFSEVFFDNQTFTKGAKFSIRLKQQAVNYCQHKADFNRKTLLIESEYGFTIWIQKEILPELKTEELDANQASKINKPEMVSQNSTSSPSVDSANINIKRYRGQVVREEVLDKSKIESTSKKPRRKYRGQYID